MKHDPDFMQKISAVLEARKAAAAILGVSETADRDTLKNAYRAAAVKWHPDHHGNTPEANKRFVLIKCAFELLAFDEPCDNLLKEINTWPGVPQDCKYRLDNPWGHFLWWRDKFFDSEKKGAVNAAKRPSCI